MLCGDYAVDSRLCVADYGCILDPSDRDQRLLQAPAKLSQLRKQPAVVAGPKALDDLTDDMGLDQPAIPPS